MPAPDLPTVPAATDRPARPEARALFHAHAAGLRDGLVRMVQARLATGRAVDLEASDVTHVALLKAAERIDAFRGSTPAELRAWVRTIGENVLRDALRAVRPRGRGGVGHVALDRRPDPHGDPLADLDRAEVLAWLGGVLDGLTPRERTAVGHVHLSGLSVAQAAAAMGSTVPAVGGLLKRGLGKLRRRLAGPV